MPSPGRLNSRVTGSHIHASPRGGYKYPRHATAACPPQPRGPASSLLGQGHGSLPPALGAAPQGVPPYRRVRRAAGAEQAASAAAGRASEMRAVSPCHFPARRRRPRDSWADTAALKIAQECEAESRRPLPPSLPSTRLCPASQRVHGESRAAPHRAAPRQRGPVAAGRGSDVGVCKPGSAVPPGRKPPRAEQGLLCREGAAVGSGAGSCSLARCHRLCTCPGVERRACTGHRAATGAGTRGPAGGDLLPPCAARLRPGAGRDPPPASPGTERSSRLGLSRTSPFQRWPEGPSAAPPRPLPCTEPGPSAPPDAQGCRPAVPGRSLCPLRRPGQ